MKELICIVCPRGCHLEVNTENGNVVSGNSCPKGAEYGYKEVTNPVRVITSTVKIEKGRHRRLPVKTSGAIPKELNFRCMEVINSIKVEPPIRRGDILVKNILETGFDLVACRDEI